MSTMCIRDFLRSNSKKEMNDEGTNHDYRMLYQKEFFMQVFIPSISLSMTEILLVDSQFGLYTFDEYSKIS